MTYARLTKAQLIDRLKEAERAPAMLRSELAGKKVEIDRLAGELFAKRAIEPPLVAEELREEIAQLKDVLKQREETIDALRTARQCLTAQVEILRREPVWIRFRSRLAAWIAPLVVLALSGCAFLPNEAVPFTPPESYRTVWALGRGLHGQYR